MPEGRRIYITGASGSGVTTLGAALAAELQVPQHDVDAIFWEPTDPPFQTPRAIADRQARLQEVVDAAGGWVLSGSLDGWGDIAVPRMELVVFLWIPPALRIARLHARELERYPPEALAPGGAMHESYTTFMAWAERYDTAGMEQRSRARHEQWLDALPCPVLRIEGDTTVADRVARVLAVR
jgi:adenylate kinase family enzyme